MDRIFVDTNIVLSGLIFKGNESWMLELGIQGEVRIVLAQAVIDEARRVLRAKFPAHEGVLDKFLAILHYESVPYPSHEIIEQAAALLRDPNDAVILASIMESNPDVALTGDRDLLTDEIRSNFRTQRCAEYLAGLNRE